MNNLKLLTITIFMTILAGISPSRAQNVGIRGGLNISNFYVDQINDESTRIGLNAGLFSRWQVSDRYGIQAELNYSEKGNRSVYEGLIDQEVMYNFNYLDLPVMAAIRIGGPVEVNLGMYAGYLLNASISSDGDLGEYSDDISRDDLQDFDFGFLGGLNLNFNRVQAGVRYNLGMVKIADSPGSRFLLGDAKHSVGQIYVGFKLNK